MKKLSLIFSILLMLVLVGCGKSAQISADTLPIPGSSSNEPEVTSETDNTVPVVFPPNTIVTKYYSITLPDEWKDNLIFEILDLEDGTYNLTLYELTSHEEMDSGKLCTLMLIPTGDDAYKDFPDYELICELDTPEGSFYVIALFPTDVQFNEETMDIYNAMVEELMDVLWTIQPNNGIEIAMP